LRHGEAGTSTVGGVPVGGVRNSILGEQTIMTIGRTGGPPNLRVMALSPEVNQMYATTRKEYLRELGGCAFEELPICYTCSPNEYCSSLILDRNPTLCSVLVVPVAFRLNPPEVLGLPLRVDRREHDVFSVVQAGNSAEIYSMSRFRHACCVEMINGELFVLDGLKQPL
jgi:hypothetical protein